MVPQHIIGELKLVMALIVASLSFILLKLIK